jgi:aquaporin Z
VRAKQVQRIHPFGTDVKHPHGTGGKGMQGSWLKNTVVEFVGTFALIFVGAGSIIATGGQNLVAIALAHGLALGLMVAAAGHISGGLFNPSVTIGLMTVRRMPVGRGIYYILAQLVGALVAALTLKVLFPAATVGAVNLGTPTLGPGIGTAPAALAEVVMTFFLVYSVFGVAVDNRGPRAIAGLVIGLTITMDIFVGGGLTGAAMNPARWFGPAVVQGTFDNGWLYWLAPTIGAMIAALLWNEFYLRGLPTVQPGATYADIQHVEDVNIQRERAGSPDSRREAA